MSDMIPDGNTGHFLVESNAADGTASYAMRAWRLRVGWIGQGFNMLTGGWWCRAMLRDPKPSRAQGEQNAD